MSVIGTNGPAIWGGCVTRRSIRPENCPGRPESCHGARRVWRNFCRHGTNFAEHYECRGTRLIGSRTQVKVYKYLLRALARSCYSYYKAVKGAGAKAKSVTNNLPILSVL